MTHVELVDLPTTIRGFTKKTEDDYTIVINARMSENIRLRTYQHELEHIERGDLDSLDDIDRIEKELHDVGTKDKEREIPIF